MGLLLIIVAIASIAIWLGVAMLSGDFAEQRGRNGGAWTVGGLLLGPWAIVLLVLLPPILNDEARLERRRRPMASCPRCGLTVPVALQCSNCGAPLAIGSSPEPEPKATGDDIRWTERG